MSKNRAIINSIYAAEQLCKKIMEMAHSRTYATFEWQLGQASTLPQKALLNIWIRKYAAFILKKPESDLQPDELKGMKRAIKIGYYNETHESFMVETIRDPWHPEKERVEVTSAEDWSQGETARLMEWLQAKAANDGLILESGGEYKKIRQRANT